MSAKRRPGRKLRIAQIAPLIERVPPKKYGGTERIVSALTEGLVSLGHEVTLFASGDSITAAALLSVYPRSLREAKIQDPYGLNQLALLNFGSAYARQDEFDIIHDHNGFISLPTANVSRVPVIMTEHGPFGSQNYRIFEKFSRPHLVTISRSQARFAPRANHLATVHNGLNMEHYPFSAEHEGYLLFVGRISMEKGTHLAIEAAQYLDMPLIIAAKLDRADLQYFNEYVGPRLSDDRIRWIGEVEEEERNRLMSKAVALLHSATWLEPFGLTMIEAMACGTPVIGFKRGSVPEIVVHGKTGFAVDTLKEMIDAIQNVDTIDRTECRRHALAHFNAGRMVRLYERLYYHVLKASAENR